MQSEPRRTAGADRRSAKASKRGDRVGAVFPCFFNYFAWLVGRELPESLGSPSHWMLMFTDVPEYNDMGT